jgi:predicted HTH transcriptional regulator
MLEKEIKDFIHHGSEERYLEYKESIDWNDSEVKAKITKSILAMSNIQDGGVLVIGVKQKDGAFIPQGMSTEHLKSFDEDNIKDYVSNYADAYVEFNVKTVDDKGKEFVVIQVREFLEVPVICKKDGLCNLRKGAIYTRSRRKPETIEVPSQSEMREVVDLAVEKGIRKFMTRLVRVGITPSLGEEPSDDRKFEEELEGL